MMAKKKISPKIGLKGEIMVPGDKSVCHRSVILGALADGPLAVSNFSMSADNMATVQAFRRMGISIVEPEPGKLEINGCGLKGLKEPEDIINAGNSGTTMRLLTGLLSGQGFFSVITGDDSLRKRPMRRVVEPLRQMGALIYGRDNDSRAPLAIKGAPLKAVSHESKVSSAQVKTSLLLAGIFAEGTTWISEPHKSRDHTERMMTYLGVPLQENGLKVGVVGGSRISGGHISVPGDFSSAAFFLAAALLLPESDLTVRNLGLNPTRDGFLRVLKDMGADIEVRDKTVVSGEPVGDLHVRPSRLKSVNVDGSTVPLMVDEFPVFCVVAALAEGDTVIRDAAELRVKETDRIAAIVEGLKSMGVEVEEFEDGMTIHGCSGLKGAVIDSHGDHRIAMAFAVAGLVADGTTIINDVSCVQTSFPGFFEILEGAAF
jgi:3-phosphoshikimate 1-carboxyvinyltransferase